MTKPLVDEKSSRPSFGERHPVVVFVLCVAACVAFPFTYNLLLAVFH